MKNLEQGDMPEIRDRILSVLPAAAQEMAEAYSRIAGSADFNPGAIRVFAVGSIVYDGGQMFEPTSDIDIIFGVDNIESSLIALPSDAVSRSEADSMRDDLQHRLLREMDKIGQKYDIPIEFNVPHGQFARELKTTEDFSEKSPAILLAEFNPTPEE